MPNNKAVPVSRGYRAIRIPLVRVFPVFILCVKFRPERRGLQRFERSCGYILREMPPQVALRLAVFVYVSQYEPGL